jgi:hypothetical protein
VALVTRSARKGKKNFAALRAYFEHQALGSIAQLSQYSHSLPTCSLLPETRVFGFGIRIPGSLTFEVTCVRQRAALAR